MLYVVDVADELIVARYPIDHLKGPAAIRDFKLQLRETHGLNDFSSTLQIIDSKESSRSH